jgi:hypothetical protein
MQPVDKEEKPIEIIDVAVGNNENFEHKIKKYDNNLPHKRPVKIEINKKQYLFGFSSILLIVFITMYIDVALAIRLSSCSLVLSKLVIIAVEMNATC